MPSNPSTPSLRTIIDKTLDRSAVEELCNDGTPIKLVGCDLEGADISRLDLASWIFDGCILRQANLIGANLEETQWTGCRGGFADFTSADLSDSTFQSSDFNNASFKRATLTSCRIERCKMTGANLSDAATLGLSFEATLLAGAILPLLSFRKMTLRQLDFAQADLMKCDFRDSVLEDCSLRDANLADARFEGADLRGADLGGLRLFNAKAFRGATISREQAGQLLSELGLSVL